MGVVRQAGLIGARFARCETAATAIEYAMIAVLIAAAVSATVFGVGDTVKTNLWGKLVGVGS